MASVDPESDPAEAIQVTEAAPNSEVLPGVPQPSNPSIPASSSSNEGHHVKFQYVICCV